MKLLLLQTDIKWLSPDANRRHAEELISKAEDADIVVLPEMFTTGFAIHPEEAAEKAGGETLAWMQQVAASKGAAIAGSVAIEDGDRYFNRFYFVKPDGSYTWYDKRHLFSFGGEDKRYTQGDKRVIVEYKGCRILLQVCYDLRFPVFARNRGDYDLILYSANWPDARRYVWDTLLRARAIENICYVAGVQRVGSDPAGNRYSGGSALLDYLGRPAAEGGEGKEDTVAGEIDLVALKEFRAKFPALGDADKFTIL